MSAHDNWSDSDSEDENALADVETNVELGIPNGEITSTEDLDDPVVSRIGGIPVRLHSLFAANRSVLNHLITLFPIHISKSVVLPRCASVVPLEISTTIRFFELQNLRVACRAASSIVVSSAGQPL